MLQGDVACALAESGLDIKWRGLPVGSWNLQDIFHALAPHYQYDFVYVAGEELASYLFYLQVRLEVGKEDEWAQLSTAQKRDFEVHQGQDLLRKQDAWVDKLCSWRIHLYLEGQPHNACRSSAEDLEEPALELCKLLLRVTPNAFRGGAESLSAAVALQESSLKKEAKQEPVIPAPLPPPEPTTPPRRARPSPIAALEPLEDGPLTPPHQKFLKVKDELLDSEDDVLQDIARPRKKQKVAVVLPDSGDEDMPAGKEQRLSRAAKNKQLAVEGGQRAKEAGVTFNVQFQAVHLKKKDPMPRGHWGAWCQALMKSAALKCASCRALRDRVLEQETSEGHAEAGDRPPPPVAEVALEVALVRPAQQAEEAVASNGRGRPKIGAEVVTLATWLELNRPGMYKHKMGTLWICSLCNAEVQCFRKAESGRRYVKRHEKHDSHRHKLGLVEGQTPCPGIALGKAESSLDRLRGCCEAWHKHGCIQTKAASEDNGRSCVWTWRSEALVLKHRACVGQSRSDKACGPCQRLADSKSFQKEVAHWGLRIEYATFMHTLVYGTDDERLKATEALQTHEGNLFFRGEIQSALDVENPGGQVWMLKRLLQSVPTTARTPRLHEFIEMSVRDVHFRESSNTEREAFKSLCDRFATGVLTNKVNREDLQLAAAVAAGKLSGNRVVSCLLQSFCLKQDKLARGLEDRVNSSKLCDEATTQEIYWSLGRSQQTNSLLHYFGVNLPDNKVTLTMAGLPEFWLAHTDVERISESPWEACWFFFFF